MTLARTLLGGHPGPTIEVDSSTRCTMAPPGTKLDHLDVGRDGHLYAFEDERWTGAFTTMGECTPGDLVYAFVGVQVGPFRCWELWEIMAPTD